MELLAQVAESMDCLYNTVSYMRLS